MLTRRVLLKGASMFGLGRPDPSRFPYPGRPQSSGTAPGQVNVVRVRQVFVGGTAGSGIFVYNGPPTFGNLIESHTPLVFSGTDGLGNGVVGGDTIYFSSGPTFYAIQRAGDVIAKVWTSPFGPAGPYTAASGWGTIFVSATAQTIFINGTTAVTGGPFISTSGTPVNPSQMTTDSWNNMTLVNGWNAMGGYAEYLLNTAGTVSVRGLVGAGTLTNGTIIWTAPSGYIPSSPGTQSIEAMIVTSTGAAGVLTPRLGMSASGGNLFVENIPTGTTQVAFNGSYSLT